MDDQVAEAMFPVLKPLIARDGWNGLWLNGLPVVDLGPDAGGVLEPDQLDHAALVRLVARALRTRTPAFSRRCATA